ncbi:MAG: hypothetical protein WAM91_14445 [Candidatus Acidiferrales bacterium]
MEIRQLTNIVESAICLTILIPLLLSLWPTVRLDQFRQDMFAVRDELFDYAASGKISFNDPAYRLLRQLMNGFIRYGHQLTFFRVCVTLVEIKVMKRSPAFTWAPKWEQSLANIKDEEVRDSLRSFHSRVADLAATRVVFGSPVLVAGLSCAALILVVQKGLYGLTQLCKDAASTTFSHFMDARVLEEEAVKAGVA